MCVCVCELSLIRPKLLLVVIIFIILLGLDNLNQELTFILHYITLKVYVQSWLSFLDFLVGYVDSSFITVL